MDPPEWALEAARQWASLTRWERAQAGRALRRLGWTYGEIMEVLPVGKGTLAGWCREIRLTHEQIEGIKARRPSGIRTGIPVDTARKRRAEIARIREEAAAEVAKLITDSTWVAGTILYWAEGSKTRGRLELVNSDPAALRLFVLWTRRYHSPDAIFSAALHLHAGNNDAAAKAWWSDQVGVPVPNFTKTFIKPPGTGHRKNHLVHGVCRVTMRRSTNAWVRTQAWIQALAESLEVGAAIVAPGR